MSSLSPAPVRRRRIPVRGPAIALVAVAVPMIGWAVWSRMSPSQESGPEMYRVAQGEFIHEITDRGNVESADNTEIKCEVKSKNLSGTQILDIVPEGTEITEQNVIDGEELVRTGAKITDQDVREGRVLVRLDSSSLEVDKINQEILLAKARAEESQAFAAHEAAKSALKEYLGRESLDETDVAVGPVRPIAFHAAAEAGADARSPAAAPAAAAAAKTQDVGTADQQRRAIESEIAVAEENYSRAKQYLKYSLGLYGKGYVTRLQLQADRFAMDKAETDLEIARTKLDVFNRFTHGKQRTQLSCDLRTARARLDAAEAGRKLNEKFLNDINEQLARCIIVPKKPGQVVYANVTGWRGAKEVLIAPGEMARERQVLLRLPNPDKMQVIARVNEAKVTMVKLDMPAKIRLDAFPEVELTGSVVKVDAFPAPTGFMGSVVKEYDTTVKIDDPPPGVKLKPGLTAQVKILIERRSEALQIKVQSVFEHGNRFYCVVPDGRSWAAREVRLGPSNDKFVVVESGLEKDEEIVLNANAYRDKVKLPDVPGGGARAAKRRRPPADFHPERPPGAEPMERGQPPDRGQGDRGQPGPSSGDAPRRNGVAGDPGGAGAKAKSTP